MKNLSIIIYYLTSIPVCFPDAKNICQKNSKNCDKKINADEREFFQSA